MEATKSGRQPQLQAVGLFYEGKELTEKETKEQKRSLVFGGLVCDAETAYTGIFQMAAESITVIDPEVSIRTLELIRAAKKEVPVIIYTDNEGEEEKLTRQGMKDFFAVNKGMRLLIGTIAGKYKNRYIILDSEMPTQKVFVLSDSISASGPGVPCMIRMEDMQFVTAMLKDLEQNSYLILK